MTDADKKSPQGNRIAEKQRYNYIGFEVFPGEPKDLFKSKAEQQKLVDKVVAKRSKGGLDLEGCTLVEERVSFGEKLVLAVASVAMLLALLLPWYSVYTEVSATPTAVAPEPVALVDDSLALIGAEGDSLAEATTNLDSAGLLAAAEGVEEAVEGAAIGDTLLAAVEEAAAEPEQAVRVTRHAGERSNEEILTGHAIKRAKNREYEHLSGFGTFISLGSVGSAVFSSGFILVISAILMLVYGLLCIGLPALNLYSLFGLKGSADEVALAIKKYSKYNWLPVCVLFVVICLSFIGADYGFDLSESFTSIGDSYGVGALLGTLSWGVFVSAAASVMVAVKGIEI
ncbi:MAG: hypothetical protein GY867_08195 [bacterium]|nr:hypothetical protein [bacterium]